MVLFTAKDRSFFCFKFVSFYAIWQKNWEFTQFQNRELLVSSLRLGWCLMFKWLFSVACNNIFVLLLCVYLYFIINKFNFPKFLCLFFCRIFLSFDFFPLHWCILHGGIRYLKNQFSRWIRLRVVSGILSAII